MYYETRAVFSSTTLRINNKDKREQMKVVLYYKSEMGSNTFLFDTTVPEIGNTRVGQAQVASTYVQLVAQ